MRPLPKKNYMRMKSGVEKEQKTQSLTINKNSYPELMLRWLRTATFFCFCRSIQIRLSSTTLIVVLFKCTSVLLTLCLTTISNEIPKILLKWQWEGTSFLSSFTLKSCSLLFPRERKQWCKQLWHVKHL